MKTELFKIRYTSSILDITEETLKKELSRNELIEEVEEVAIKSTSTGYFLADIAYDDKEYHRKDLEREIEKDHKFAEVFV